MRLCTKQLIKSVSFLLILILLLAAGSRLFLPKDNRSESGMEELAANGILGERDSSIDVLFIGDSEAVSSFSPMEMWNQHGFTSYVCATSGQPMNLSYYYLVRAFQKQTPKVVVLETDTLFQGITMDKSLLSDASLLLPIEAGRYYLPHLPYLDRPLKGLQPQFRCGPRRCFRLYGFLRPCAGNRIPVRHLSETDSGSLPVPRRIAAPCEYTQYQKLELSASQRRSQDSE